MNKIVQFVFKPKFFVAKIQSINTKPITLNAMDYYNNLLLTSETNKNGRYKFKVNEVGQFINLVTEENIKVAIESFNNILGHNQKVTNQMIDKFLKKCIDYGQTTYVLDVLKFHTTLRYFPNPSIISSLGQKLDNEGLITLCKTIRSNQFLKVTSEILSQIIKDDPKITYEVYRIALEQNIQLHSYDLYRIARQFLVGEKVRKAGFMAQFITQNCKEEDIYGQLSLLFTQTYLNHYQEAIILYSKIINTNQGIEILKKEETFVKPLITLLQQQVEKDEKWKSRLEEILIKS